MLVVDGQTLPVLLPTGALAHRLAGSFPEYQGKPNHLLEGDGYLKGCKVLATWLLSAEDAEHIVSILGNPDTYGDQGMGSRCFFPGFAFSFGKGHEFVHVQVCLECSWVVFHSTAGTQSCVPSEQGESHLRAVYERLVAQPFAAADGFAAR